VFMFVNATDVQLSQTVEPTPEKIIERYRRNRDWRLYKKEWIYRNIPPSGLSWLDFGCGTGEITTQLAILGASRVIGVDVDSRLIDMTRRRAELDGVSDRVQAICGDLAMIEPQPVDVVLSYAVLHHLADHLRQTARLIRQWLKPGGVFICAEPVSLLPGIEWLREHSGVAMDPLDPGERKLTGADLRQIEAEFPHSRRVPFSMLGRFGRLAPSTRGVLLRMDALLRPVPGAVWFAGNVIDICRLDG
jgi:SAM-dependent methyltransferase